jgi:hypothetical protein
MMTHEAKEKDMRQAMDEIDRLAAKAQDGSHKGGGKSLCERPDTQIR